MCTCSKEKKTCFFGNRPLLPGHLPSQIESSQIGTIPVWESTGKSSTTTPDSDLTVLSFWGLLKVASPLQTPGPSSCWPSGAPCERGGPSMGGSRVKGFLMVMRATKHVPIDCTAVGQPTTEGAMPKTEPTSLC